jgi:hypothetical protein
MVYTWGMPRTSTEPRTVERKVRLRASDDDELERRARELGLQPADLLRTGWRFT